MKSGSTGIPRPKRWDVPFSEERDGCDPMTTEVVSDLLRRPPFCDLDEAGFKRSLPLRSILVNDARIVNYEPGDIIVREGDWGNSAFFILSGTARVALTTAESSFPEEILGRRKSQRKSLFQTIAQLWRNHREPEVRDQTSLHIPERTRSRGSGEQTRIYLPDVSAVLDQYRTAVMEAGQWFGEIAALGRSPRVASVFADTRAQLLEIRWQGLRDLMRNDRNGALRRHVEGVFRERSLASFLRTAALFRHVSPEQMEALVAHAEFDTYGTYDSPDPFKSLKDGDSQQHRIADEPVIAEEGHHSDSVILIRSGLARISRRHFHGRRTISYLMPGQVFGLDEARRAWTRSESVPLANTLTAIGFLNVVKISIPLIEEIIFQSRPDEFGTPPGGRRTAPRREQLEIDDNLMNFLVDGRFVQGTATMVIDLDRCTRCDDCVRACASAHDNNPRFIRHGPVHDHYMLATACLHCADPVCMIECPTGAIHRDLLEGEVVINDETCIGCTRCATNCPYHAIRMVDIRDADGGFLVDHKTGKPLQQATKCDLCVEQIGGPACQRACPHDALVRIDMRDMGSLENYINR